MYEFIPTQRGWLLVWGPPPRLPRTTEAAPSEPPPEGHPSSGPDAAVGPPPEEQAE